MDDIVYIIIVIMGIILVFGCMLYWSKKRNVIQIEQHRAIVLPADLPIENRPRDFSVPNIRPNMYIKYIGDLYSENSEGLYLSVEVNPNYKLVLSREKTPFTLHEFDNKYLNEEYSKGPRPRDVGSKMIPFVTLDSDSKVFFELSSSGKGYVLSRRIHMCGAHGYLQIDDDGVGFDLHTGPRGIFRLENDMGEFIFIH